MTKNSMRYKTGLDQTQTTLFLGRDNGKLYLEWSNLSQFLTLKE